MCGCVMGSLHACACLRGQADIFLLASEAFKTGSTELLCDRSKLIS